jgi:hypothetical protein
VPVALTAGTIPSGDAAFGPLAASSAASLSPLAPTFVDAGRNPCEKVALSTFLEPILDSPVVAAAP